jgi:predicted Zn finger-like uncharacterized protein
MPTIVDCPSCARKLRVTDELLGQRVKCPTCGGTFAANAAPANGLSPEREPSPEAAAPPSLVAPTDGTPPPLPTPAPVETVPIRLSVDDLDKPARPVGSEASAPSTEDRDRRRERRREFIRCPHCEERISADSRRCRYCGEDLDEADEFDIRKRRGVRRDCEPHRGTLILVLGIISIVIYALGLPLGLPAWIMGRGDLRKMDRGEMDPAGRSTTQAGYICGIIGTILGALGIFGCIAYFGLIAVFVSTASTSGPGTKSAPVQVQPGPNNPPPGRMK